MPFRKNKAAHVEMTALPRAGAAGKKNSNPPKFLREGFCKECCHIWTCREKLSTTVP
jgi:hypothetical protein